MTWPIAHDTARRSIFKNSTASAAAIPRKTRQIKGRYGALVIPAAIARGHKRQLGAFHDDLYRTQYWGARRGEDVGDRFVDHLAVQRPRSAGRKQQRRGVVP